MIHLGALLLVSVSLGLSNFAAAIAIGLSGVDMRTRLRTGLAFGSCEAVMPIIGILVGRSLAGHLGAGGRYAGCVLLVLTGLYEFWQGRRGERGKADANRHAVHEDQRHFGQLLITGIALSLDNLVVGVAISYSPTPILLSAAVIAVVSVAMSLIGLELGDRLGERIGARSTEIGAGVLILVGLAIGLGVLG